MAAKKYFVDIDLNQNELVSAVLQNTTSGGVASPVAGQIIFDTGDNVLKYYDGTAWQASETRLDGALQYKGSIAHNAAAAASPQQGDLYVFNSAGTATNYGGGVVEAGDFAIYNGSSWDVIQGNTVDASESDKGVVELATDAETIDGSDTVRAITPSNLTAWATQSNKTVVRKRVYSNQTISTTGTTLTHGIGTDDPQVAVYDSNDDEIDVLVEIGSGTVTLTVNGTNLTGNTVVITA
jgi:hypothetical protein